MKQISNFNDSWNKVLAVMIIVAAIIYDISPIDFIPDVAIGVGQIDDIAATLYAMCNAWFQFRKQY